eukprot:6181496-Pleurochrysis_carterae.AAC.4
MRCGSMAGWASMEASVELVETTTFCKSWKSNGTEKARKPPTMAARTRFSCDSDAITRAPPRQQNDETRVPQEYRRHKDLGTSTPIRRRCRTDSWNLLGSGKGRETSRDGLSSCATPLMRARSGDTTRRRKLLARSTDTNRTAMPSSSLLLVSATAALAAAFQLPAMRPTAARNTVGISMGLKVGDEFPATALRNLGVKGKLKSFDLELPGLKQRGVAIVGIRNDKGAFTHTATNARRWVTFSPVFSDSSLRASVRTSQRNPPMLGDQRLFEKCTTPSHASAPAISAALLTCGLYLSQ